MTPEELEELRALAGRLSGTAYNENLAAILGAALEHIHMQEEQLANARAAKNLHARREAKLLSQVAALQEIAIKGQSYIIELEKCMIGFMENNGPGISEAEAIAELARMKSERMRDDEARCQLSEEHREVFR